MGGSRCPEREPSAATDQASSLAEHDDMAHTVKVIAVGFAILVICLVVGRVAFGSGPHALASAALVFIPIWLVGAAINMWFGVTKAGYSVKEETPYFLIVFAIPALVAIVIWWIYSRR